jgi:hypothetical protein
MSKLEVDAIEPQSGTTLTIGASGDLSSTDPLVFPAGTVSLPAITTTGDTNTGIFFPAADTIAFTEGGAEAMRIDSSGNVLINTTDASTLTAGIKLRASDNAIAAVVTSNPSGYFGRLSTDGDIIKFRKALDYNVVLIQFYLFKMVLMLVTLLIWEMALIYGKTYT